MHTVITPPETLAIEPCTHCQLHCPGCPDMDLGHPPGLGWGRLKFEHFRRLIDETPAIKRVYFDCFGDVLLNKDILPMLEYGAEGNLGFSFSSANFNHVPDAVLEALVKQGVEEVAQVITALIDDPAAARSMGAAGQRWARTHVYSEDHAKRIQEVVRALSRGPAVGSSNSSLSPQIAWA